LALPASRQSCNSFFSSPLRLIASYVAAKLNCGSTSGTV
jgi:hypothetical protein